MHLPIIMMLFAMVRILKGGDLLTKTVSVSMAYETYCELMKLADLEGRTRSGMVSALIMERVHKNERDRKNCTESETRKA